ncbi:hypothetical protein D3C74_395940 [compost metagenome]
MPNKATIAPPRTAPGTSCARAAIFGTNPMTTRIPPATTMTSRVFTRVICTSPTFCEYVVYGNELKIPPNTMARPSARYPRARSLEDRSLSKILPKAINTPVDSATLTIATRIIVKIGTISKVGLPK